MPYAFCPLVLAALWLALGWAPRPGLKAWYHSDTNMAGPYERSYKFAELGATRLDRRLAFSDDSFPLHFFNDSTRFNFHGTQPDQLQLPFSVYWSGFVEVPEAGPINFYLSADQPASLSVGGSQPVVAGTAGTPSTSELSLDLQPGLYPLEAALRKGWGPHVELRVEWDQGGRRWAVDRLWPGPLPPARREATGATVPVSPSRRCSAAA